jgi:hypothetical protein
VQRHMSIVTGSEGEKRHMISKWSIAKIGAAVSCLSVVFGYSLAIVHNPWWLCLMTVPAVLSIAAPIIDGMGTGVRKDCLLAPELADALLVDAVRPRRYPLCSKLTATHSSGVAVGAIVARGARTNIGHLKRMMTRRRREMKGEKVFSPRVARVHLHRFKRIYAICSAIISGRSLMGQYYTRMDGADGVIKDIDTVCSLIDEQAILPIEKLLEELPKNLQVDHKSEPWSGRIKEVIVGSIPEALAEALKVLDSASSKSEDILSSLRGDWEGDRKELWGRASCRPAARTSQVVVEDDASRDCMED